MTANSPIRSRKPAKLFVVGMWRSGTSLMYALLNKHPQIALLYEGDLLLLRPLFWKSLESSEWTERWEFWNNALSRHGMQPLRLCGSGDGLHSAAQRAYEEYAAARSAIVCGEKSPNYYDRMQDLSRMFPEAKFLIVWRDPAGVCESVIRAAKSEESWFTRRGMVLRALLGCRVLKRERDRLVKNGVAVCEVQYEKLVSDPAGVMMGVCEFLNLPFSPQVASLEGADRSAIYTAEHHARVRGGEISRANRNEILPGALKQKIGRYIRLWRRQSGGDWPAWSAAAESSENEPGIGERVWDSVAYRVLRQWDEFIVRLYCLAPLALLARFREMKLRGQRRLASPSSP